MEFVGFPHITLSIVSVDYPYQNGNTQHNHLQIKPFPHENTQYCYHLRKTHHTPFHHQTNTPLLKAILFQQINHLSLTGILNLARLEQQPLALHPVPQFVVALRHVDINGDFQITLRLDSLVEPNRFSVLLLVFVQLRLK